MTALRPGGHEFKWHLRQAGGGSNTCSRPRARVSGPKARRPSSTSRSRQWRQPCHHTKSANPRLPSSREKFFRISRGSKASMATLGLIPAMPANRRTGIISTMDGKRVPQSSSAMRLTCWRRWLQAARRASIRVNDIGALIVNTITGLAIPSLDAKLMNRLRLSRSVERLPIFGLGCGGGVGGLARAARYAQAMPVGAHVLFLTIDLCSLCLRIADPSVAMFVAAALFGDGAAGVVLRNTHGTGGGAGRGTVLAIGDHFWPNTEQIMGWDIKEDGFGVVLSPELPELIRAEFMPALNGFLDANRMDLGEFSGFIMHPGGAKILKTIQKLLRLSREDLAYSWDVLRDFGNMSSPTALFGLARAMHAGARGRHLLTAFGPGFSAYFVAIDLWPARPRRASSAWSSSLIL